MEITPDKPLNWRGGAKVMAAGIATAVAAALGDGKTNWKELCCAGAVGGLIALAGWLTQKHEDKEIA